MAKDYYKRLKVKRTATKAEIAKAYRKRALKIHPDRVPESKKASATRRFKKLVEAYDVLSNDETRRIYDSKLPIEEREFEKECQSILRTGKRKGQKCGRVYCNVKGHERANAKMDRIFKEAFDRIEKLDRNSAEYKRFFGHGIERRKIIRKRFNQMFWGTK